MLSVEAARAKILAALHPTGPEIVPVTEAGGRVLAAAVVARLSFPPADVSAMDGYALRAADPGPRRVIGAAPAGHPFSGPVGPNQAVRLFTGSVLPSGADTVVIQENVTRDGDTLTLNTRPTPGDNIRRRAQDFAAGDAVLPAGTPLGAAKIGLCAAANHPFVTVHRRPVVAILSTGDEVALPGEPIPDGGLASSNGPALAAMVAALGAIPRLLAVAADDAGMIAAAADAARGADLLLTTGGASVGDHDLIQPGLAARGFVLDFWKIAMRPGKPLLWGDLAGLPVLGLPGNPVSALVCAALFAGPAIRRLAGHADVTLPIRHARAGAPLPANDGRADHLRATLETADDGTDIATPFPIQDSSMIRRLALAGALILRPPHAPAVPEGTQVPILRLTDCGL